MPRMRWSQLRTKLAERCAPVLREHVALHQARYRNTREEAGRVWLTIDGREVASFDTAPYMRRRAELGSALSAAQRAKAPGETPSPHAHLDADEQARTILREAGEYDDYEALVDLEAYLSLPIDTALRSPSPLVRALAVIDRRVGKRKLRDLTAGLDHPLVRELYALRCKAEGLDVEGAV